MSQEAVGSCQNGVAIFNCHNYDDRPEVETNETCDVTIGNSQEEKHGDVIPTDDDNDNDFEAKESIHEQLIEPSSAVPPTQQQQVAVVTTAITTAIRKPRSSWWYPRVPPTKKLAEHLARCLYDASDILLARLFTYLSNLPEPSDSLLLVGDDIVSSYRQQQQQQQQQLIVPTSGVTLPASALAWLSSQIIYLRRSRQHHHHHHQQYIDSLDDEFLDSAYSLDCDALEHQQQHLENALWMGSSMRDRLLLIHFLLPRATHIRIVPEPWPKRQTRKRRLQRPSQGRSGGGGGGNQHQHHHNSPLGADQDLAFSSMSVQSALTEDDSGPPEPNAASFLHNFYHLEQRPRIDVSMFSNLQVLVLDQVPPDCMVQLCHARHTLRVLRVERACIYNLHAFLFSKQQQPPPHQPSSTTTTKRSHKNHDTGHDPLAAPPASHEQDGESHDGDNDVNMIYSQLTHIKLSHCCLGEMSGMRTSPTHPPPLSRCTRLVSLCLSHNQLFKSSTALAGLASLPWLKKLDLSYNQIVSMKNAHLRLGNLKILILTGNKIRSANGLDRLYSLEQLWLDDNDISDIASLNGLGRLPELSTLHLQGNPLLPEYLMMRYRIDVLNLFMCRLTSSLGPDATYRQLQHVLPILDGKPASLREMVALRDRTFQSVFYHQPTTTTTIIDDSTITVSRRGDSAMIPDNAVEDADNVMESTNASQSLDETATLTTVTQPKKATTTKRHVIGGRVRRGVRRRKAVIEDEEVDSFVVVPRPPPKSRGFILPSMKADNDDDDNADDNADDERDVSYGSTMKVAFSIHDVISAISPAILVTEEGDLKTSGEGDSPTNNLNGLQSNEEEVWNDNDWAEAEASSTIAAKKVADQNGDADSNGVATYLPNDQAVSQASLDITTLSLSSIQQDDENHELGDGDKGQLESNNDELMFPEQNGSTITSNLLKSEATSTNPSASQPTTSNNPFDDETLATDLVEAVEVPINLFENETSSATGPVGNDIKPTNPFEGESSVPNSFENPPMLKTLVESRQAYDPSASQDAISTDTRKDASSVGSLSENIDRVSVAFTDDVWQDDHSVQSSIGGQREELSTDTKFQLAEENSSYDGPPVYQSLLVSEHLELYFRCYVFPTTIPQALQEALNETVEDTWQMALMLYPRLQLQPIDRQLMISSNTTTPDVAPLSHLLTHRERLVRVGREDVVACGKPAARRLFPNRHTRLGFHGDILWTSNGKIDVVTECRTVILCLSNTALYFLLDHDAVTDKLKDQTRSFPLPMSKEAKFSDAPWPHAVARHSLLTLQQITIGFGFKRLILRFSNATYPSNDYFTYNVLVSNKVEAISLLQDLQRCVKDSSLGIESDSFVNETNEMRVEIDNEDKHFLDALALAVAPAVFGAVVHYQILRQRWQHGERSSVRRACVVTDSKLFLLDEDYAGDGSSSFDVAESKRLGDVSFRLVDSADLNQITEVKAADEDPKAITIVIRPSSRLLRTHRWRLVCRDGDGAERLVEDVRKAMAFL